MAGRRSRGRAEGGWLRTAERMGVARGVFGGNKGWFYVGTGLWTLRTVRRMAARQSEVLLSEELKPGQRLVIANGRATLDQVAGAGAPPSRRARRRRRR